MDDGLPSNYIYRTIQDYKGNLWICTPQGISKYDGYTFKNYSVKDGLPTNDVFNLIEDFQQRIWIINNKDQLCYIKNDSIVRFDLSPKHRISIVNIKPDFVDVYNYDKLYRINAQDSIWELDTKLLFDQPKSPEYDPQKKYYSHDKLINFKSKDKELFYYNDHLIYLGYQHASKTNIISKATGELNPLITDFNLSKIINFSVLHTNIRDNELQYSDSNKFILFDTLLNYQHFQVTTDSTIVITSIFLDDQKNLWLSTKNGLFFIHQAITNNCLLLDKSTIDQQISNLREHPFGIVYSNSNNEIHLLNNLKNNSIIYDYPQKRTANTIFDLQIVEKDIYFSLEPRKIFHLKSEKETTFSLSHLAYKFYIPDGRKNTLSIAKQMVKTKNDAWFFISPQGLFSYQSTDSLLNLITETYFTDMEFSDSIGLLLDNSNVYQLRNSSFDTLHSNINNPYKIQSINRYSFLVFTENEQTLISDYKAIKEVDFLKNYRIFKMIKENDQIWLLHNEGVIESKFDSTRNELSFVKEFLVKPILEVVQFNDFIKKSDTLILASSKGLYYLHTSKWNNLSEDIPLNIEKIQTTASDYDHQEKIILPYDERSIEIFFKAIFLNKNENPSYYYRLKEIETAFIKTNSTQVRYPNLNPGNYVFEVYATTSDLAKSDIKSFTLRIRLPWWRSYWFLGLCLMTFIGLIVYLFKRRERKLEEKAILSQQFAELELNALQSQMNPHFVFNAMGSLQNLIQQNKQELADEYVAKFARLMRMFLEASKHKFISLKQELEIVKSYFEMEKLRFKDKINLEIVNELDLLEMQQSIPASLIQPFVENAINHGLFHKENGGLITLNLYSKNNNIIVEIIDNGIGRKKAREYKMKKITQHESRALDIIQDKINAIQKLEGIKISYEITDLYHENIPKGTKIHIIIQTS